MYADLIPGWSTDLGGFSPWCGAGGNSASPTDAANDGRKKSLRAQMLQQRLALPQPSIQSLSLAIASRVINSHWFKSARKIALYVAIRNEVNPIGILHAGLAISGKIMLLPRVSGKELQFVPVNSGYELTPGFKGILEPVGKAEPVGDIDLFLVPGLVFDRQGHRIGYGKGYYDVALDRARPDATKIGLAFGFQVVQEIPAWAGDIPLDMLVSEDETIITVHGKSKGIDVGLGQHVP